jgi:transposase
MSTATGMLSPVSLNRWLERAGDSGKEGARQQSYDAAAMWTRYAAAVRFVAETFGGAHVWAIEGTGSYGAGLARYLAGRGVTVLEAVLAL